MIAKNRETGRFDPERVEAMVSDYSFGDMFEMMDILHGIAHQKFVDEQTSRMDQSVVDQLFRDQMNLIGASKVGNRY